MKILQKIVVTQPLVVIFAFGFITAMIGWNFGAIASIILIAAGMLFLSLKIWLEPSRSRKTYTVDPGEHRSIFAPSLHLFKYKMTGRFKPLTKYVLNSNVGQLNKICGLGWGHHHKMSLRITETYDWVKDCWKIYAYWYDKDCDVDGKAKYHKEFLYSMKEGDKPRRFEIGWDKKEKEFYYKDNTGLRWSYPTEHTPPPFGYYLFPNIGRVTLTIPWKVDYQFIT